MITRKVGEGDSGDPDYVRTSRLGLLSRRPQGRSFGCKTTMAGRYHSPYLQPPRLVNKQIIEIVYLALGYQLKIMRQCRGNAATLTWSCFGPHSIGIYDRPGVRWRLKVRILKTEEETETPLHGCSTWSPNKNAHNRPPAGPLQDAPLL